MTSTLPPRVASIADKGSPNGGLRLHVSPGDSATFYATLDGQVIKYRAMFIDDDPDRIRVVAIRQTRKGADYQVAGLLTTVVFDVAEHPTPGRDLRAIAPEFARSVALAVFDARHAAVHAAWTESARALVEDSVPDDAPEGTPTRWAECANGDGRRTMHASGLCAVCRRADRPRLPSDEQEIVDRYRDRARRQASPVGAAGVDVDDTLGMLHTAAREGVGLSLDWQHVAALDEFLTALRGRLAGA